MKQRRVTGEAAANGRRVMELNGPRSQRSRRAGLARAWCAPIGVGVALLTAALLMSACADASSSTTETSSTPAKPTSASMSAASATGNAVTATPSQDPALTTADTSHGTAAQPASSARPSLELAKAKQLAAEQSIAERLPSASGMTEKRTRPLTLRDSGIDGSLMFARDVDFRVTGDIGFMIHDMAATLSLEHPGQPIVFDDPTSVTINVHRGDVTLDSAKLTAIFDRYLFQYQGSPLRNMRVVPQDGGSLRITGEMHRETWVPIVLSGALSMRNANELVFHADHVEVAGVGADKLMQARARQDGRPAESRHADCASGRRRRGDAGRQTDAAARVAHDDHAHRHERGRRALHAGRPHGAENRLARDDAHPRHADAGRRREIHAVDADEHRHGDHAARR
ncbi:hypothetical protein GGD41_000398 [Paraburkholderia bryophila]|uniref:Uncharacterized protein n=1 Tax=Paraburkholderia bryophila TaxID=420952 RepID=A0A7Y9W3P4_9BURK|nr:hypothetical protein [Paraburkholderia bryophila]